MKSLSNVKKSDTLYPLTSAAHIVYAFFIAKKNSDSTGITNTVGN